MELPAEEFQHSDRVAENAEWLRLLARNLVQDATLADDVSQDTLVAALSTQPPHGRLEHWMATILRNRVRRIGHRDRMRIDAEASVARERNREGTELGSSPEGHGSVLDEVSRHHELMSHLLELPENYREPIVLRYLEQASHEEISERLGIAEGTVRTRLTRGLSKLRERIEARHGAQGAVVWLWAAAGEPGRQGPNEGGARGVVPEGNRPRLGTWAAASGIAVTAWLIVWLGTGKESASGTPDSERWAQGETQDRGLEDPANEAAVIGKREGSVFQSEAGDGLVPVAPKPAEAKVRGRAIDPHGQPLVNFGLAYMVDDEVRSEFRSDGEGYYEYDTTDWEGRIEIREGGFVELMAPIFRGVDPGYEQTVVASPSRVLRGRVSDESGAPLPHAYVSYHLGQDFRSELGRIIHLTTWRSWFTRTDAKGEFVIDDAPSYEGFVRVKQAGRVDASAEVEEWGDARFDFVLEAADPGISVVPGRVVDSTGRGLADAWVSTDRQWLQTDPEGRFQLTLVEDEDVTADIVYPGFLPVEIAVQPGSSPVEVVMREPAMALSGRVVDDEGRPLEGIRVFIIDRDYMDTVHSDQGPRYIVQRNVESLMAGIKHEPFVAETDEEGHFEIPGLQARPYRLRMVDDSMRLTTTEPLHPSETVNFSHELCFHDATATRPYSLRVVDSEGQPVEGLVVILRRHEPGETDMREAAWGPRQATGVDGLLHYPELVDAPEMALDWLTDPRFVREHVQPALPGLEPGESEAVLVVHSQAYLQVELDPTTWTGEYRFTVLDEDDRPVTLSLPYGITRRLTHTGRMLAGLSPVYGLPSHGQRLIVVDGDDHRVLELALDLSAGELETIHR